MYVCRLHNRWMYAFTVYVWSKRRYRLSRVSNSYIFYWKFSTKKFHIHSFIHSCGWGCTYFELRNCIRFLLYFMVSFISIAIAAFDWHMLNCMQSCYLFWVEASLSDYVLHALRNVQKYLNDEITVAISALLIVNVDLKFLPINSLKWNANTLYSECKHCTKLYIFSVKIDNRITSDVYWGSKKKPPQNCIQHTEWVLNSER